MTECRDCEAGLEHCHGTVIHHISYRTECTEPDCVTPEVAHAFVIDCEAIGCTPQACCGPSVVSVSAHRVG
ncbi:hypothetical protein [Mycobacterium sp. 1164985.4]|uniref:hypothetical protein n=1 Tax=Mycobacterium sp. 1164985.4 TaxID=1834069 RepID=UPI000800C561|nr:hypothetical protein [Mycobacterium sp. 1164985.4]OBK80458.1 hypothetical protein A5650_05035 [Mycobacterium sp. 1164985.4]